MKHLALLALTLGMSLNAHAELSVDEIIAKHIEARGGYAAIMALRSARFTGVASFAGAEAPILMEWSRPNHVRMEFQLQGMTMVQAYDGEQGWAIQPFIGKFNAEAMSGEELKDIRKKADLDGELVDYQAKGNTVELIGVETIDDTEAYHLQITEKDGAISQQYLDTEYFLTFKAVNTAHQQGFDVVIHTTIGDYKEVAGVLIPHAFETIIEGAPAGQSVVLTQIEANVEIPSERFSMPVTSATQ